MLFRSERREPGVRDAGLMAVAQHLEHDAIASYECVCHWAGLLGLTEAAGLLALNMAEERRAEGDRLLEGRHGVLGSGRGGAAVRDDDGRSRAHAWLAGQRSSTGQSPHFGERAVQTVRP